MWTVHVRKERPFGGVVGGAAEENVPGQGTAGADAGGTTGLGVYGVEAARPGGSFVSARAVGFTSGL